jgi:hypothetical protein
VGEVILGSRLVHDVCNWNLAGRNILPQALAYEMAVLFPSWTALSCNAITSEAPAAGSSIQTRVSLK